MSSSTTKCIYLRHLQRLLEDIRDDNRDRRREHPSLLLTLCACHLVCDFLGRERHVHRVGGSSSALERRRRTTTTLYGASHLFHDARDVKVNEYCFDERKEAKEEIGYEVLREKERG